MKSIYNTTILFEGVHMYKPYMVVEKLRGQPYTHYYYSTEAEALTKIKELQEKGTFDSAHYAPVIQVFQIDKFVFV